jgi:hypothetical protein
MQFTLINFLFEIFSLATRQSIKSAYVASTFK